MSDSSTQSVTPRQATVLEPGALSLGLPFGASGALERLLLGLPLAGAAIGVIVAFACLLSDQADVASTPALAVLGLALLIAAASRRWRTGVLDRGAFVLAALCFGAAGLLLVVPHWMYGWNINAIIHHSVVSIPLLLLLSTAAGAHSIRSLLGATPSGEDLSLYPWLALPVSLALLAYVFLVGSVVISGLGGLKIDLLTTAYHYVPGSRGGVAITLGPIGFLNNILGTFLLMGMSLLLAILPGIGAGVFMSEYPGRLAGLIDFCTQMLRAVSMFVIGAAALAIITGLATSDPNGVLTQLVNGDIGHKFSSVAQGTFLFAAAVLAVLVMPVIAKMTEEGLRSVPRDIREGSVALGASDGYGLRRILLRWATPNIVTGLLLAAAEVNGSLAVIMFFAGIGDGGVGPMNALTSLDYAVFQLRYGPAPYVNSMGQYQMTAALLLLIITVGLTAAAMLLQRRFAKRYRGSLTSH